MLRALLLCCGLAAPVGAETRALMEESFVVAQQGMASAAGAALRQIGQRAALGDDALAVVVRERQALAGRLQGIEAALAAEGADRTELGGQVDQIAQELRVLDARIVKEFPRYGELTRPQPLSLPDVARLLHKDEALILFFVGGDTTWVWAVSPKQQGWHSLQAGKKTMADAVTSLRASIGPVAAARSAVPLDGETAPQAGFDRALSAGLYRAMLAPLEPVFGQAKHIYIVPDGPLTSLPLSVLITDRPVGGKTKNAADLRGTEWLIKRHAITTLPSVEALGVVRRMQPPEGDLLAFAGFGDPVLGGTMQLASLARGPGLMRNGVADVDQLSALAPLPQTRGELLGIAQSLGAGPETVRLGAMATETAVKAADLSKTRVLAFATHGLLSGDLKGLEEPALVLTPPLMPDRMDDGLLTASEITDLSLNADWVVLSACNTAGGEIPGAEGLSGLARAFLFAGARSILVTHWPVRDDAAARITTDVFARLKDGRALGKSEALRQAMLELMADASDPSLAEPAAWAPFALVGEGE